MKKLIFIVSIVTLLHATANAETESTLTPLMLTNKNTKGRELRGQAAALIKTVKTKNFAEAERMANHLKASYEAQFNKHLKQHSFQSEEEYNEFIKSSAEQFEWIDWGYKECLQMLAFIKSEKRDFLGALEELRKIEAIAPISSASLIEIGYVLNQFGKHNEALSAYRKARDLSLRYATQRPFQAPSLRGIGYSLIDLKRYNEAKNAYQESLKLDPNNPVALKELEHLQHRKAQ